MANRTNKIRRVQNAVINKKVFEDLAELLAGRSDPLPKGAFTMRQAIGTKLGKSSGVVYKNLRALIKAGKLTRERFKVWTGMRFESRIYYF